MAIFRNICLLHYFFAWYIKTYVVVLLQGKRIHSQSLINKKNVFKRVKVKLNDFLISTIVSFCNAFLDNKTTKINSLVSKRLS